MHYYAIILIYKAQLVNRLTLLRGLVLRRTEIGCVEQGIGVYLRVPTTKRRSSEFMPMIIDNEEYYTVEEACDYLGGITRDTLRRRAEVYGIQKHTRGVTKRVYYRKVDLDKLNRPHPVDDSKH